jgi:hypothetical protein
MWGCHVAKPHYTWGHEVLGVGAQNPLDVPIPLAPRTASSLGGYGQKYMQICTY